MEALKVKVEELIVNQDHMLNAIKYLSERLEEVTEKMNYEKSDMKEVLDSQAMIDGIVVKASDDILTIKKTKDEKDAGIKLLDTKIDMINQEIETLRNSKIDKDKANDISRSGKPSSLLKCTFCDIKFNIFSELERHIKDSHEIHNTFKCDKCEKEFVLKWRLKKHMSVHRQNIFPLSLFQ
jgi:chromosome segregation ATPase